MIDPFLVESIVVYCVFTGTLEVINLLDIPAPAPVILGLDCGKYTFLGVILARSAFLYFTGRLF